jgi:2-polyprenyl-3-methyl-5-hydroxy-6-metoxy-1,4-benzoquinol methylase/glycosyltransferase involved in cell wall biosynthesis
MMRVVSVASGNEVAGARILARALAEHHPDWPLTVLVLPGVRPTLHPDEEPFELLEPSALGQAIPPGVPAPLRAALARALVVRHALDAGAERVLVLPPDAELRGPLDAIARDTRSVLLVPRLLGGLPQDGERPDSRDLLDAGEIDDELVAVRGDERGLAFTDWWIERRREDAEAAAAAGGADARPAPSPLAAALASLEGVGRLEDPAYDVSFWNLHERSLAGARLVRFAGFRADRPWWLSEHASRTLVLDDPALTEACGRRARALLDAGWLVEAEGGGGGRELPGGLVWNERLRRLHTQALEAGEDFGDIYAPAGARAFAKWLTTPGERGAAAGIGPYALDPWKQRRDLRDAFGDLDGEQGEAYVAWLWAHGRAEMSLADDLLPPPPEGAETDEPPPVLVTGYLGGNLGLGEAARGYTTALRAAGVPVATSTLVPELPVQQRGSAPAAAEQRAFAEVAMPGGAEPAINLLCVNAPQVPALAERLGEEALRSRYTIGQWAWETDAIPPWWDTSFDLVDEVWVYSRYVAENLARATDVDVPVVVVPLPVSKPDGAGATLPFELPDGFVFLFAFDFFSTLERKNPLGLIEAFKRAFEPGEGPTLLLKTINARHRPEARERVRHAIAGREDILLVDALLEPVQMAALFERADSYVSLHRAEGYGLTLAESMALGKPVVATGFSGNTDFMTPANSYLVDWTLTKVGPEAEHYPEEGTWAEPSLEHAAATLREVVADRAGAAARGARAAADIAAWLSPEAVGEIARKRLVRIGRRRRAAPPAPAAAALPGGDFEHRLEFDLGGGERGGPKGAARRALFRALRPYTASERELDRSLAGAVRRLALELHRDRAAHAREQAQLQHGFDELRRLVTTLMHQQEELRGQLDLQETTRGAVGPRVDALERTLDELIAAARAAPYMAGEPLGFSEAEGAGRVLGFSHEVARADGDDAYARFEDVFRGPRERVAELVAPYVALLAGHAPVLDVGCGRGELLEQLGRAGIEARGVDADAGMAERARAAGLDVTVADAVEHLESLDPASLGAITAIHVIEHMPADALARFFRVARERLRPGGLLVCETINPHAVHALKTFWVDLTHQHPVFPEVAVVLADVAGFRRGFMWFPRGTGDAEADRFQEDAYAVVAEA